MPVKVAKFKRYFLQKSKEFGSGNNANAVRWKWFTFIEVMHEIIAHKSTLSSVCSGVIFAQCIDVKEEAVNLKDCFSNVKEIPKQRIHKSFQRI